MVVKSITDSGKSEVVLLCMVKSTSAVNIKSISTVTPSYQKIFEKALSLELSFKRKARGANGSFAEWSENQGSLRTVKRLLLSRKKAKALLRKTAKPKGKGRKKKKPVAGKKNLLVLKKVAKPKSPKKAKATKPKAPKPKS
ncbi:hypothetical protein AVEN_259195-1 [Araneus ventricosus]|uniref:Uncharacterized protein n=1 Tax=Araneus ventricosus TaxID=182803 RepID=A0A4Y2WHD6_ARAVE|nr:hypothetical protein AVEN_259195-1 [Araneus ventricosus]